MEIQNERAQKNPSEEEYNSNTLHKIGKKLKKAVFGMFSLLVKEQEVSVYIAALIPLIEFLQVISFAFHQRVHELWGFKEAEDTFHFVLGFLRLLPYVEESKTSTYQGIFYFLLGMILLLVLGLTYIYYMSLRRKTTFGWQIQLVGFILVFSSSVFFLPVFEYLTSIFACKNQNGSQVHNLFPEIECWKGVNFGEAIIAIFASILFLIITTIATLILFEARPAPNNFNARMDSRAQLIFNIYKVLLVLTFNLLMDKNYQIAQIALMLIGSTIVFVKFQFENPFYNNIIMKVWSTLAALNLWTAIILVFAKIMESKTFKETIFVWLLMIPLVIFLNVSNVDKRFAYFLINQAEFKTGNQVMNHISYLKKIIQAQKSNKAAATMLDGYLHVHRIDCFNEQCPCRIKGKAMNNNRIIRNLLKNNNSITDRDAAIIYLIYQMYLKGIKSFPKFTSLWISYSFFLMDKMGSKQQALQVLTEAELRNPAIDYEFILYRYKKIIEDEFSQIQHESQAENGLDLGSESSFQNHFRLCQANIEKSSLLHVEFWSQLSEDRPDLAKLGEIGAKINASIKAVEDQWNKLVKINPNNVKSMRLFGKYIIEVINDKEKGEKLLEQASNFANTNFNKKKISIYENKDFSDEAVPIVVISGDQENFGIITNLNLAASSLFAFNKTELLNKKLTTLMSPLYAKHHDNFLERYLHTNDSTIIGMNKERLAFGKTKANYVFPFFYNVKAIPSMIQGVQFISTFRVERKLKNTAYILTDAEGTIDSISSSCISLLKIDRAMLQAKPKIQDFFPNILYDREQIFTSLANGTKASALINFTYPQDSDYLIDNDPPSIELVCHLYDIVFHNDREHAGFQFRFEKHAEKGVSETFFEAKLSNFQFSFDKHKPVLYGEYISSSNAITMQDTQDYNEMLNGVNSTSGDVNLFNLGSGLKLCATPFSKKNAQQSSFSFIKRIKYGSGIKTYKLVQGLIVDTENEKLDENDEENDSDKETQKKGENLQSNDSENQNDINNIEDESSIADFSDIVKSSKALNSVIKDRTPPQNLKRLNLAIHLLTLFLFGLSTWEYINISNKIKSINQKFSSISQSRTLGADMMIALSKIRDLYLVQIGILDDVDQQALRKQIRIAFDSVKATKEILEDASYISDAHLNLYNNPVVFLKNYQGAPLMTGFIQATEDIITKGLNLAATDLSLITLTNPDYFFVTHNLLNDYFQSLLTSADLYLIELFTAKDESMSSFILIFVLSIVSLVFSIFILVPILVSVSKTQEEVLKLFLDIPEKMVKTLYSKCENFVSNLQMGEEDEMSEADEDEINRENENEAQGWRTRRKTKKFRNTRKSQKSFVLGYLVISLIIESPFIYNFVASSQKFNELAEIAVEYNLTSSAELLFSFSNNAQRQLFIDPDLPILNQASLNISSQSIDLMKNLNSNNLRENSVNIQIQSTEYNQMFYDIFYGNPCSKLTAAVAFEDCESFANHTVPKGMSLLLVRHFENMNLLLKAYQDLESGKAWPFDPAYINNNANLDIQKNQILSLMRIPRAKEIATTQDVYIAHTFRKLISSFLDNLQENFDSFKTGVLLAFLIFIMLILVLYVFVWMPLMSRLNTQIWKTKTMLNMIPINVIVKIKSIRTYLRNMINQNHLHQY